MPSKKPGKAKLKPPNHVMENLQIKAAEAAKTTLTTKTPEATKFLLRETKQSELVTNVNEGETKDKIIRDESSPSKDDTKCLFDASWSDFPAEQKLLKIANQKRSNNDFRGAIDLYIQVYDQLEKLCQIPAKRLTVKIVPKIVNAYTELGEFEEAKRALEKAVALKQSLARLLCDEAQSAMDKGEIKKAEALISEAVELWNKKPSKQSDENSAKYLDMLQAASNTFLRSKKIKKAIESCNRMIEHDSLEHPHYVKRSEMFDDFMQLIKEDDDFNASVDHDYDLADVVVDGSMMKNFCIYKGKNHYRDLDSALKLSLGSAAIETDSFRIFVNPGVYEWPLKTTLKDFLAKFGDKKSKTISNLKITGTSTVVFLPNAEEKNYTMEIVKFSKGQICFKNISFGERKPNFCQKGFLVCNKLKNSNTLFVEKKVKVNFDTCIFSNIKIETSCSESKFDRSWLMFDFCHFENQDMAVFELKASWWKVSLSNCLVKQDGLAMGLVARVGCQLTISNTDIVVDNGNSGDRVLVIGETASITATGCYFRVKTDWFQTKVCTFGDDSLPPSAENVKKWWPSHILEKPLSDILHKSHDLRILNGAKCNIETSNVNWRIQVNASDAIVKNCRFYSTVSLDIVAPSIALQKSGNMSVIGNKFVNYTIGIQVAMGAQPLIDKNAFVDGTFSAITVQQQSAPIIRRNQFKEGDEAGQVCAILYLPEFSSGRIEHNTFQDFSFQPIFIFLENKVEVIHNSYVDIDYMRNSMPLKNKIANYNPKPWFMVSLQDKMMREYFKSTYDAIFHNKMEDLQYYKKIGCAMMEGVWPNEEVKEFWQTDYGTKRKKKIVNCQKHKNASAFVNCQECDSEYETRPESEEESEDDSCDYISESDSESDDKVLLERIKQMRIKGKLPSHHMLQRSKTIEVERKKRETERACRKKDREQRQEMKTKSKLKKQRERETYLAIVGGAQLKECFCCGKVQIKAQQCSQCKLVHFCDIMCQKKSWPNHKVLCKLVSDFLPHILDHQKGSGTLKGSEEGGKTPTYYQHPSLD